jgi:hypothetical protein
VPVKLIHRETGTSVHCSRRSVDRLVAEGYVLPGSEPVPDAEPAPVEAGPPSRTASKDSWVEFAAAQGVDDAESLTKAELVDLVGGQ